MPRNTYFAFVYVWCVWCLQVYVPCPCGVLLIILLSISPWSRVHLVIYWQSLTVAQAGSSAQAGLELSVLSSYLSLTSAGIEGVHHHALLEQVSY